MKVQKLWVPQMLPWGAQVDNVQCEAKYGAWYFVAVVHTDMDRGHVQESDLLSNTSRDARLCQATTIGVQSCYLFSALLVATGPLLAKQGCKLQDTYWQS